MAVMVLLFSVGAGVTGFKVFSGISKIKSMKVATYTPHYEEVKTIPAPSIKPSVKPKPKVVAKPKPTATPEPVEEIAEEVVESE
jgi:hypothetical protein